MYQKDWIAKLSMVLQMNERNVLTNVGKIAMQKADAESGKYKEVQQKIEKMESIKELKQDIKQLKTAIKG